MNTSAPPTADDPRVIAALDEYVAALEAGRKPDRAAFLAVRPDVAGPLANCLDGLDLVHQAVAQLDPPAIDSDLANATPLGDFRLLRILGRGGMGVVYEAEQLSLGRRVALKVLPFAAALDPKQLQRFKHEAQAAAHLQHAHIVPVHGVGCERGVHYYAMQLIDGRSLAEVIRELRDLTGMAAEAEPAAETRPQAGLATEGARPDPAFFRRAARLGLQAARALEHAHQVGVIHRDVKPANLLVDMQDHLWVTDFGLAQFQGQAGLTLTGDVLGTLRYMSPEQAAGGPTDIDHRTDVYSLGATLYELLTLRPVLTGTDRQALVRQITDAEPVPPRRLQPAIPRDLETIVLKALAKAPADRYGTAQAMADDLERFLEDRPVAATRPGPWRRLRKWARRHRPVVVTAAAAGAALLVTAVVALAVSNVMIARERNRTEDALAAAKANLEAEGRQRQRAERNSQRAFAATNEMLTHVALNQVSRFPQMERMRRELLQQALQFYQVFAQDEDPDPVARHEAARALVLMAGIYFELARPREAAEAAGRARDAFESLTRDYPADRSYRAGLAEAHRWLGGHFRTPGDRPPDAEAQFRRVVSLFEQLAAEDPIRFRPRLADVYHDLAYHLMHGGAGHPEEAEQLYRKGLAVRQELEKAGQGEPVAAAGTYNALGILLRLTGRPGEAEPMHRKALALWGWPGPNLTADELGTGRARSHFHLALALWQLDRRDEAVRHATDAVAVLKVGVAAFPLSAFPLAEFAPSYRILGQMLERAGRPAEAGEAYRQALGLAEKLVAEFRERPESEGTLINVLAALIRFRATDDPAAAATYFRRMCEFEATSAPARNDLAWHLATFPDPRFRDARRAVEMAEKATAGSQEGTYWNTLGVARYRAGDWTAAIADLEKSLAMLADKHESFNTFFLAMAHWRLGHREPARQWYAQAVRWMEANQPKDKELQHFRAEAEELLGVKKN